MNRTNTTDFMRDEGVGIMQTDLEAMFYAERAGEVYFVDGNKTDDSHDGSTWANAFKYLSTALAASHANIAITANRNWAGRNTIYVKADSITEDLVLLADKTDVIGVGAKDSYDMPCIVGNHVPTNGMSTRFFNVQFRGAVASGAIIWTLASGSEGIVFKGCHFNGWSTTPATIGLKSTASPRLRIEGCKFFGAFSTAAIHLLTGDGNGTIIRDNLIQSGAIGIDIDSGFTCSNEQAWIIDNRIKATGLVIDDDSDTIVIMGNLGSSAGTLGGTSHDIPVANSAGNIIAGATTAATVPFATIE